MVYFTHKTEIIASASADASGNGTNFIQLIPGSIEIHGGVWIKDLANIGVEVCTPKGVRRLIEPIDAYNRTNIGTSHEVRVKNLLNGNAARKFSFRGYLAIKRWTH